MKVYQSYILHARQMNTRYPILEKMILERVSNYQPLRLEAVLALSYGPIFVRKLGNITKLN